MKAFFRGMSCFFEGANLMRDIEYRRYVLAPIGLSLLLLGFASWSLVSGLEDLQSHLEMLINGWPLWEWIKQILIGSLYLFWPLVFLVYSLVVFYSFILLVNIIAAPFNSLLSEKVQKQFEGIEQNQSIIGLDWLRPLHREWIKLKYYIPRALGCGIVFLIPGVNIIAPMIWLAFSAWMLAIQYTDLYFDNAERSFRETRKFCRQHFLLVYGFGTVVLLFTLVPFVNIAVVPAAVISATLIVGRQRQSHSDGPFLGANRHFAE